VILAAVPREVDGGFLISPELTQNPDQSQKQGYEQAQ
jgi:hypothetical protein